MPQTTASLPIACVEGWSAGATWTGVPVRDLLALVGAPGDSEVSVLSLQQAGGERASTLAPNFSNHPHTLLALQLHGETLSLDHGFPCRLIAPDRPGVLQTKWVGRLEVMT
jgi:DMSO/TMAO reductase YedYZ molybdopterin-dependent catalytic subunit